MTNEKIKEMVEIEGLEATIRYCLDEYQVEDEELEQKFETARDTLDWIESYLEPYSTESDEEILDDDE